MENEDKTQEEEYDFENIDDQDFCEDIPPSEGSVVKFLLKQLHIGMSLSQITLPTFILEPRSTLERFTDWMAHADILRKIKDEPDPYYRCLHLCTWIVAGFHLGSLRPTKPYNSVIGEVYRSVLVDNNDKIIGQYMAEQVSHHPPISAFHYRDPVGGVVIWGHTEMRSKFLYNSIAALMDHENTRVNLEIPSLGETYEFNFPNMYGRGILFGKMRMEICGQVRVSCKKTDINGVIDFLMKPLFRKRYNQFKGQIWSTRIHPAITFKGRWTAYMKCVDKRNGKIMVPFDVRRIVPLRIVSPPIEEQCEFESQYIWQCVSHYIKEKDSANATIHKLAIEEKQRKEREFFDENNIQWELQVFHFDQRMKRFVPNNLDLTPRNDSDNNEQIEMPEKFHVPVPVVRALECGATVSFSQLQRETEKKISTDHPFVFDDENESD
ncbi:Oxysterol-binding protein [Histomonas meleagridis]|uniref:Oxysterol-binding protein n=1 Tax=Histomonas meleagridis TaxID=135588 RepID=UPI0035596F81|nr:Oxysterol-binding protein [Histomonas meleagridis]KAH0799120.1 Oxysterol-binding protein [Histomonas meleagridis]